MLAGWRNTTPLGLLSWSFVFVVKMVGWTCMSMMNVQTRHSTFVPYGPGSSGVPLPKVPAGPAFALQAFAPRQLAATSLAVAVTYGLDNA